MKQITEIEKSQFNNEVYEDIWVTLELDKNDYAKQKCKNNVMNKNKCFFQIK